MKKYEVKHKHKLLSDPPIDVWGVWNNNMQAWQYVNAWDSNETRDWEQANIECKRLNTLLTLKSDL